ncbi:hypothetical protein GCK72_000872 [Caenorhabditis remanei]|uniref:Uncharacterized protein n=1 Tax=Caenorhabditis remanei TaxID=31234 RepID=A0A6A5HN32_CAERE|nr:hypothetical protein GCK72_000872 [Caenorhabditis remanei]KAF1769059.1 hypothetical protein GCK72_000872 [Caenorhabditis remanei]
MRLLFLILILLATSYYVSAKAVADTFQTKLNGAVAQRSEAAVSSLVARMLAYEACSNGRKVIKMKEDFIHDILAYGPSGRVVRGSIEPTFHGITCFVSLVGERSFRYCIGNDSMKLNTVSERGC